MLLFEFISEKMAVIGQILEVRNVKGAFRKLTATKFYKICSFGAYNDMCII